MGVVNCYLITFVNELFYDNFDTIHMKIKIYQKICLYFSIITFIKLRNHPVTNNN